MYDYLGKDELEADQWQESRKSQQFASAQKDALEIAKNSGVYLYAAVVVAQLGLFNDLLVAGKLKSTNYAESGGIPTKGFLLDGLSDVIKAFAMEAYNSKIFGSVESTGFKTIEGSEETTIPIEEVPQTLYKYSDMTDLIPDQETFASVSGTVEGFSFDRLTKRANSRILMGSHGYESENISAKETHMFTKVNPDRFFGQSFYFVVDGYYSGNFSKRTLFKSSPEGAVRTEAGSTAWILVSDYISGIAAYGENYHGEGVVTLDSTCFFRFWF
jgi:hypothetical protein